MTCEQELNRSVLTLSSDSELSPENSPIRKNQMHHEESSDKKTSKQIGKGKDVTLIGSDEDSPSKKASSSVKEKKKSSLKREGTIWSYVSWFDMQLYLIKNKVLKPH